MIATLMMGSLFMLGSSFAMMNNKQVKSWNSGQLKLEDFQGNGTMEMAEDAAHLHHYIDFRIQPFYDANDPLAIEAEAVVDRSKSWIVSDAANQSVVAYQQLRFDLAEMYSRKLKYSVEEGNFKVKDFDKVEKLRTEYNSMMIQDQQQMDIETQKGSNAVEQRKWKERINAQLHNLKN